MFKIKLSVFLLAVTIEVCSSFFIYDYGAVQTRISMRMSNSNPFSIQDIQLNQFKKNFKSIVLGSSAVAIFPKVTAARLDFDQKEYEARPNKQDAQANPNGNAADYKSVRKDLIDMISARPEKGPTLVRLAWHSSGTYDKMMKNGGSQKGTIRFEEELKHSANAGLDVAVAWLEPIYKKFNRVTDLSYADLYTLAGVVAIKELGGPDIKWRSGREDSYNTKDVTPNGRLPDADKGSPDKTAAGLRTVFNRMGFNDQEIVALSGAHALGRCHASASGYAGAWTFTPTTFNNQYYVLLKGLKWVPAVNVLGKPAEKLQYEDPSGKLYVLGEIILKIENFITRFNVSCV